MVNKFEKLFTNELCVLCHNDLINGNLLNATETDQLALIDFEYAGFGFPETDLYNFMIESTYDYSTNNEDGFL